MMIKILFVAPLDTMDRFKGGITSYAESIIKNSDMFLSQEIKIIPFNNCIVKRKSGTNGKMSFKNWFNYIKAKKAIAKELKTNKYDAIYLNTSFGIGLLKDLMTLKRKYAKTMKVILHIHFADLETILTNNRLIKGMIIKRLKNNVTDIISLSTKLKKQLVDIGIESNNVYVLYNYFDPKLPLVTKNGLVNKKMNPIVFMFMGSFERRKGFYELIDVFKELRSHSIKLRLCGIPNEDKAKEILNQISNDKMFIIEGYVSGERKNNAYNCSHVLILPSHGEGLPITILEAMNFGLPIISTNVGAIPEIINEKTGILINPGDKEAMKNAVCNFISNPNAILEKGLHCLEQSREYSFDSFSLKMITILKDILYSK